MTLTFVSYLEVDSVAITGSTTTTLTSASFTPAAGELLVVKAGTGSNAVTISGVTGGSLTWTPRVNTAVASGSSNVAIYTASVSTSAAMTVSVSMANASSSTSQGSFVVERYTGATLASSPATHTSGGGVAAPAYDTITSTVANSLITWTGADFYAGSGSVSYASGATQTGLFQSAGNMNEYYAVQTAATPGSQTYGTTTPSSQHTTLAALEIIPASTGSGVTSIGPIIDAFNPPPASGLTAVVGDNSTNDQPALQAALNYVSTTYGGGRVLLSKPNAVGVKCSSGITIPAKVQLVSDEATLLNFSGIGSTATAITVNDSNFTPLVGIRMDGGNFTPASSPTNATIGISVTGHGLLFEKLHVEYFGRGVDLAHNSTYIVEFRGGSISTCGTSIYNDIETAGVSNSGERIVFTDMTISGSNLGFAASAGGQSLYLTNCSIDFCTVFGTNSNAYVYITGCHLETGGTGAGAYLFHQTGNGHTFFSNTNVIMGGGRTGGLYYMFDQATGPANYGFGSVRYSNVACYYVDQGGNAVTRFSTDMVSWPSGQTTATITYPFALRWTPVTVSWISTDGAVIPNSDVIRISAMDTAAGTVTLTAPAYAGQRWARVSFE